MTIYDYTWPTWPRDRKIVEKTPAAHGNGVVRVKTAPQVEPVSLDELKSFAYVDGTQQDSLLEMFLVAARQSVEDYLKRVLIEQTLVLSLDWWPEPVLELPRPPLLSVVEVRTLKEDGTETVYSSDAYYVRTDTTPGQIVIKTGSSPPINTDRYYGGYEVEYTAGYSSDPDEVPGPIKHGILLLATHMYEQRSPTVEGTIVAEVPGLAKVLGQHSRVRI